MWQKPFYRWSRLKTWTSGQNQAKCNKSSAPRLGEPLDFIIFITGGNLLFLRRCVCVRRTESLLLLAEMIDISHPARSRGSLSAEQNSECCTWLRYNVFQCEEVLMTAFVQVRRFHGCVSAAWSWTAWMRLKPVGLTAEIKLRLVEWSSFSLENQQTSGGSVLLRGRRVCCGFTTGIKKLYNLIIWSQLLRWAPVTSGQRSRLHLLTCDDRARRRSWKQNCSEVCVRTCYSGYIPHAQRRLITASIRQRTVNKYVGVIFLFETFDVSEGKSEAATEAVTSLWSLHSWQ